MINIDQIITDLNNGALVSRATVVEMAQELKAKRLPSIITSAKIEEYINYAELEMGPECCEDWAQAVAAYLRANV